MLNINLILSSCGFTRMVTSIGSFKIKCYFNFGHSTILGVATEASKPYLNYNFIILLLMQIKWKIILITNTASQLP